MKVGDLVKFTARYEKQEGRIFLVLRRAPGVRMPSGHSMWVTWDIADATTGQVMRQIERDLEVIGESR